MKYVLFLLLITTNAYAGGVLGPGVNNGGGGWACRSRAGTIKWFIPIERFEAERVSGTYGGLREFKGMTADQIVAERMGWVEKNAPDIFGFLKAGEVDFKKNVTFYPGRIPYLEDAGLDWKPMPDTCQEGLVEYVQVIQYSYDDRMLIDASIWNSDVLSERDRAVLMLHERIYKAFRTVRGDFDAHTTHDFGMILFAQREDYKAQALRNQLESFHSMARGPNGERVMTPKRSTVILGPVDLVCRASAFNIPNNQHEHKVWKGSETADEMSFSALGFNMKMHTWSVDGRPYILEITDIASGISTRDLDLFEEFKANGRVRMEMTRGNTIARLECTNEAHRACQSLLGP